MYISNSLMISQIALIQKTSRRKYHLLSSSHIQRNCLKSALSMIPSNSLNLLSLKLSTVFYQTWGDQNKLAASVPTTQVHHIMVKGSQTLLQERRQLWANKASPPNQQAVHTQDQGNWTQLSNKLVTADACQNNRTNVGCYFKKLI